MMNTSVLHIEICGYSDEDAYSGCFDMIYIDGDATILVWVNAMQLVWGCNCVFVVVASKGCACFMSRKLSTFQKGSLILTHIFICAYISLDNQCTW